ncbi:MAG TPA: glycosyltransferase family 2 protein [Thermoleophilaceae bacterium]|nr:glycosyltransferase family 2 protein [Thermoleophilaceae bacterium]
MESASGGPWAAPPGGISVCIVCRNEADRLGPCLESASWADEVVVLDLESSDGSAELARAHGASVVAHAAVPIVETVRNVVADAASGDWVLVLDPDERVSAGLAAELRRASKRPDVDAVVMPRMNFDFGYPATSPLQRHEPQLRMYRRAAVRWPEFPNALPEVPEDRLLRVPPSDELALLHERNRSIPEALDRVRRYAPAQAQAMIEAGEVFTARRMLTTLGEKLYRHFVVTRALRDGVPGLTRAGVLVAFHLYVWAAFWHQSGARRTPEDDRLLRRLDLVLEAAHRLARALVRPARLVKAARGVRR